MVKGYVGKVAELSLVELPESIAELDDPSKLVGRNPDVPLEYPLKRALRHMQLLLETG